MTTILSSKWVKARKVYRCWILRTVINPGDRCHVETQVIDRELCTFRMSEDGKDVWDEACRLVLDGDDEGLTEYQARDLVIAEHGSIKAFLAKQKEEPKP